MQPRSQEEKEKFYEYVEKNKKAFIPGKNIWKKFRKNLLKQYPDEKTITGKTVYANVYLTKFSLTAKVGYKPLNTQACKDCYIIPGMSCDRGRFYSDLFKISDSDSTSNDKNSLGNRIENTRLVLCSGPGSIYNITNFLDKIIFNDQISIEQIVACVNIMANINEGNTGADCNDIYLTAMHNQKIGPYRVNIEAKNISGTISHTQNFTWVHGLAKSIITVTRDDGVKKTFQVTVFPMDDGTFPEFTKDNELEEIWRLLLLEGNIANHCHLGVGRAGSFTLMCLIIIKYQEIYLKKTFSEQYTSIIEIIKELREKSGSPCLIYEEKQFDAVLKSVDHCYDYGFKKGYVNQLLKKLTPEDAKLSSVAEISKMLDIEITSSSSSSLTSTKAEPSKKISLTPILLPPSDEVSTSLEMKKLILS